MKRLNLIMTYVFLIGCSCMLVAFLGSSSGNPSLKNETEKSVSKKITKGKTTKAEIKAKFGSPLTTQFNDSGSEVWTYQYTDQKDDAINYVPYANRAKRGSSGTRKELKIIFDNNGKVKNYSMNESKIETKSGLFR